MTRDQKKDLFEVVGVIAIVVSLIFLTLEMRANTATNKIAILQNYSTNWFDMLAQVAGNDELAAIIVKAKSGEELDRVEAQQYRAYVLQRLNLSAHMLSIYDEELISEDEVRGAFGAIRKMAKTPRFRQVIETIDSPRLRALILDEDGLDRYLNSSEME